MTNEAELIMLGIVPALPAQDPRGEVVVTKKPNGEIVAVTRQDDEGNILSVIAERDDVDQRTEFERNIHRAAVVMGVSDLTFLLTRDDAGKYRQEWVESAWLGWRLCATPSEVFRDRG